MLKHRAQFSYRGHPKQLKGRGCPTRGTPSKALVEASGWGSWRTSVGGVLTPGGMSAPRVSREAQRHTAAVGDVRWAQGCRWDLGTRRIREGADMALVDGYGLG